MKQFSITIIILFFIINPVFSQKVKYTKNEKKQIQTAGLYIMDYNYSGALNIYKKLVANHPTDNKLLLNAAYCYYELNSLDSAISLYSKVTNHYQKINKLKKTDAQTAFYYLGMSYYRQYNPTEAKNTFETILNFVKAKQKKEIQNKIIQCNNLQNYLNNPIGFMSYKASDINSDCPDYAPVFDISNNILYFTSRRTSAIGKIDYDGFKPEDIFKTTYKNDIFTSPENLKEINTDNYEATSSISFDGKTMFLYNWNGMHQGDIFISKYINGKWQRPELLPKPINKRSEEVDACMSPDNKILIFSSNRRGGEGGFDLYKTIKNPKGKWIKPENLGNIINTEGDEFAPVFSPDGTTLYYSSNRNDGVGGFDIYEAKFDPNGKITEVKNLGFPLNTVFDDVFYYPTLDPAKSFFVSKQENGDPDIYVGIRYELDDDMIVVKGSVYDVSVKEYEISDFKDNLVYANNQWLPADGKIETENNTIHIYATKENMLIDSICKILPYASISVHDVTKGTVVKTIKPMSNGMFVFTLDKYSKYLIEFSAPDHTTDILKIDSYQKITNHIADLDSIIKDSVNNTNLITFEQNSTELDDYNAAIMNILVKELKENPDFVIDISAFNKQETPEQYDIPRQNTIVQFLVDSGITPNRIFNQLTTNSVTGNNVQYNIMSHTPTVDSIARVVAQNTYNDTTGYVVINNTNNTNTNNTYDPDITYNTYDTTNFNYEITGVKEDGVNKVINELLFNAGEFQSISYKSDLDALADFLKDNPTAKIGIYGYTDSQGDPEFNKFLSQKRAEFVKNYLVSKGVNPKQIVAEGRSFTKQISVNKDENGDYLWSSLVYNRRVEFEIIQPGENNGLIINKIPVPEKLSVNPVTKKVYSINLVSSPKPIPFTNFDINVLQIEWTNGMYSYIYGYYPTFEAANEVLQKLLPKYPEARVFINNFNFNK